jgi:hypothetical protein
MTRFLIKEIKEPHIIQYVMNGIPSEIKVKLRCYNDSFPSFFPRYFLDVCVFQIGKVSVHSEQLQAVLALSVWTSFPSARCFFPAFMRTITFSVRWGRPVTKLLVGFAEHSWKMVQIATATPHRSDPVVSGVLIGITILQFFALLAALKRAERQSSAIRLALTFRGKALLHMFNLVSTGFSLFFAVTIVNYPSCTWSYVIESSALIFIAASFVVSGIRVIYLSLYQNSLLTGEALRGFQGYLSLKVKNNYWLVVMGFVFSLFIGLPEIYLGFKDHEMVSNNRLNVTVICRDDQFEAVSVGIYIFCAILQILIVCKLKIIEKAQHRVANELVAKLITFVILAPIWFILHQNKIKNAQNNKFYNGDKVILSTLMITYNIINSWFPLSVLSHPLDTRQPGKRGRKSTSHQSSKSMSYELRKSTGSGSPENSGTSVSEEDCIEADVALFLKDPDCPAFLAKEFALENYNFIKAVEFYENMVFKSEDRLKVFEKANEIFDSFVKIGSRDQVNLSNKLVTQTSNNLFALRNWASQAPTSAIAIYVPENLRLPNEVDPDQPAKEMFRASSKEIKNLLGVNYLRRFKQSHPLPVTTVSAFKITACVEQEMSSLQRVSSRR